MRKRLTAILLAATLFIAGCSNSKTNSDTDAPKATTASEETQAVTVEKEGGIPAKFRFQTKAFEGDCDVHVNLESGLVLDLPSDSIKLGYSTRTEIYSKYGDLYPTHVATIVDFSDELDGMSFEDLEDKIMDNLKDYSLYINSGFIDMAMYTNKSANQMVVLVNETEGVDILIVQLNDSNYTVLSCCSCGIYGTEDIAKYFNGLTAELFSKLNIDTSLFTFDAEHSTYTDVSSKEVVISSYEQYYEFMNKSQYDEFYTRDLNAMYDEIDPAMSILNVDKLKIWHSDYVDYLYTYGLFYKNWNCDVSISKTCDETLNIRKKIHDSDILLGTFTFNGKEWEAYLDDSDHHDIMVAIKDDNRGVLIEGPRTPDITVDIVEDMFKTWF